MVGLPQSPVLKKPIPPQVVNENATLGPLDLKEFIQSPNAESGKVIFYAELSTGESLPPGLICTSDGILAGILPKGSEGYYEIVVIAENESGIPITATISVTVKPSLVTVQQEKGNMWWSDLKAQVWKALGDDLPLPDVMEMYGRPITAAEIYYLLERYATLTIWDAYNLEMPGDKVPLKLQGLGPHYQAHDRGSCIVASPKDLYSYERTSEDALQAARAIAREVYNRGWTIQFAGFEKMARAAWVELQRIGDERGKYLEILHYVPSPEDIKVYHTQSKKRLGG